MFFCYFLPLLMAVVPYTNLTGESDGKRQKQEEEAVAMYRPPETAPLLLTVVVAHTSLTGEHAGG